MKKCFLSTHHSSCTGGGVPLHTSIITKKPALICFVVYLDDHCQAQGTQQESFQMEEIFHNGSSHPLKFRAEGSGLLPF